MRIVDRDNFFGSVCEVFTVLTLGKIIFEAVVQDVFGNYQENLLVMFFFAGRSVCAVAVLPVSEISAVSLYRGAVRGADRIGHADHMVCGTVSSAA